MSESADSAPERPSCVPTLVLASGSPRRSELLVSIGLHPEVRPSHVDETRRLEESPDGYVTRLAALKAGFSVGSGEVALGADTVVVLGNEVLGKPTDQSEAVAMLTRLSGGSHQVFTGQAVVARDAAGAFTHRIGALSITEVHFRPLSADEIDAYVATGEPMDKAGAYGIQGGAGAFVDRIEGRRDTVIGLDLQWTRRLLSSAGVEISQPLD